MANQYLVYALKVCGTLFAMFLMAGSLASLSLGGEKVTDENLYRTMAFMLAGIVLAGIWFWPKFPR